MKKTKKASLGKRIIRHIKSFRFTRKLVSYIALTVVAAFTIVPFIWTLSTALKGPNESLFSMPPKFIPDQITFENFVTVWQTLPIPLYLWNSVIITFFGMLLPMLIATLAGFPLARMNFKRSEEHTSELQSRGHI